MLRVVRGFGEDLPPACQNTIVDVWSVIDALLQRQGSVRFIAERVCTTLRSGLEFFGPSARAVVPSLLSRLSATFDSTGFASFIWIVGKVIRLFGNEESPELRAVFQASFERISRQVFAILKIQTPEDVPDSECITQISYRFHIHRTSV